MSRPEPQELALKVLGTITGIATILYFVFATDFGLSPVTTELLTVLAAAVLFVWSQRVDDRWTMAVLYLLSSTALLAAGFDVVQAFNLGNSGLFFVLLLATVVTLGGSVVFRDGVQVITPEQGKWILIVLGIFGLLLVGADIATAGTTTSLDTVETVDAPQDAEDREQLRMNAGTVTISNTGLFPRAPDYPQYHACVIGVDTPLDGRTIGTRVQGQYTNSLLWGGSTITRDLTLHLPPHDTEEEVLWNTSKFAVEQTDQCPSRADQPTIAIFSSTGNVPPGPRY